MGIRKLDCWRWNADMIKTQMWTCCKCKLLQTSLHPPPLSSFPNHAEIHLQLHLQIVGTSLQEAARFSPPSHDNHLYPLHLFISPPLFTAAISYIFTAAIPYGISEIKSQSNITLESQKRWLGQEKRRNDWTHPNPTTLPVQPETRLNRVDTPARLGQEYHFSVRDRFGFLGPNLTKFDWCSTLGFVSSSIPCFPFLVDVSWNSIGQNSVQQLGRTVKREYH